MAGKGSGRVGSMVYATVRGAQIVRQYNPIVFNPNTEKQVKQRSKFALLTKLAVSLSDALVFQSRGAMVSNRNAFIRENMDNFNSDTIDIKFNSLSLSSGKVDGPAYPTVAQDAQNNTLTLSLNAGTNLLAGFGYAIIIVTDNDDGKSWIRSGIVTSEGGTSATVSVVLPRGGDYGEAYVIGFPMYYKDGATRTKYQEQITASDVSDDVLLSQFYNRMAGVGDIRVYSTKPLAKTN